MNVNTIQVATSAHLPRLRLHTKKQVPIQWQFLISAKATEKRTDETEAELSPHCGGSVIFFELYIDYLYENYGFKEKKYEL